MRLTALTPLAALVSVGCATTVEQRAEIFRRHLTSNSWLVEARPQRGQSTDQAKADWTACEDATVTKQAEKSYSPGGHTVSVILYKDFEGCMRQRG